MILRLCAWLALSVALTSGCGTLVGIDHDYVEIDGALGDASTRDAASDRGTDAVVDCSGGQRRCVATGACVASCEACPGSIECISCPNDTSRATCEPVATAYCLTGDYDRCECKVVGDSNDCPSSSQVCTSGKCGTCGEPGTDGRKCKSATDCKASLRECDN